MNVNSHHSRFANQKLNRPGSNGDSIPHSDEAERGVLGSMLVSPPDAIPKCLEKIGEEYLYVPAHRTIYSVLIDLWDAKQAIDLIIFTQTLRDRGLLDQVGGAPFVTNLFTFVPSSANIGHYLDIVCEKYRRRSLIQLGEEIKRRARDSSEDVSVTAGFLREETEGFERDSGAQSSDKRRPLTIRRVDEILGMRFADQTMILPNGYLVEGERTAWCGMGGVGKSRLVMQLALCCRTGCDFLGWPTRGGSLRWLFLQTENSCRRLQRDLERMLTAFDAEEIEQIKAGVFFHTLEADDDGFLMFDVENEQRIFTAIERTRADIVVFDPLRDFCFEDLNADRDMADVLRQISRVTRRGNPLRVPLIIHHAGTGKTGIQKAVGFDRSSFGRNSKVLHTWARAVINVAPAHPDDNDVIIVASGKCSNAREFEPFAARLNESTMLYSREDDFDVDDWRKSLDRKSQSRAKVVEEDIATVFDHGKKELSKAEAAKQLQKLTGASEATCYRALNRSADHLRVVDDWLLSWE